MLAKWPWHIFKSYSNYPLCVRWNKTHVMVFYGLADRDWLVKGPTWRVYTFNHLDLMDRWGPGASGRHNQDTARFKYNKYSFCCYLNIVQVQYIGGKGLPQIPTFYWPFEPTEQNANNKSTMKLSNVYWFPKFGYMNN